jgi:NitT/TauT family transport system substrate-binding protein
MLTPFAKIGIAIIVVGLFVGALYWLGKHPDVAEKVAPGLSKTAQQATSGGASATKEPPKREVAENIAVIATNTWGGQAGIAYMNNGSKDASTTSRFYQEFGQLVQIDVIDDFNASREALKAGAIDVLCFATCGEFSIEAGSLRSDGIKIYAHYDKSFGGDALVVTEGINSIRDLVGKKIALAVGTPSHGLFLNLIKISGLTQDQFDIQEAKDGLDAADMFRKEQVAAAFVWSPDDIKLPHDVPGAKVLLSTKSAPDIIWDVVLVKESTVRAKRNTIKNFIAGLMAGNTAINTSTSARAEAVNDMVTIYGLPAEDWSNLTIAKFMTLGDNLNFFGLNTSYTGVTGEELYSRMGESYKGLKMKSGEPLVSGEIPSWREISDNSIILELKDNPKLSTSRQAIDVPKKYTAPTATEREAPAITMNLLPVEFATGSADLSLEAKKLIRQNFASLARGFNNYIRVEGNTDNVGSHEMNVTLSLRRAQSAKTYLASYLKCDPNRIVIIGHGPDKPVADNSTSEGRQRNRRTEFELLNSK